MGLELGEIDHDGGNYWIPHNMRFTPLPENQVKILATESSSIKLGEFRKENDHEGPILVLTKKGSAYTLYQRQPKGRVGKALQLQPDPPSPT